MKRILTFLLPMILLSFAVFAAPFTDLPSDHWAYDAINKLAEKGILRGYPNGVFKGNAVVTRFALSLVLVKTLSNVEQIIKTGEGTKLLTKEDLNSISKLIEEFADELALVGVKTNSLQNDMNLIKGEIASLKDDVSGIKDDINKGGLEKIKITGDWLIRHTNMTHRNDWAINPLTGKSRPGNTNNVLTESQIRFKFKAHVDDNITAFARWSIFKVNPDNINGAISSRQGAFGRNGIGNNTVTDNTIDYGYLKIKDMFRFGGDFTFGRKYYYNGHGMLLWGGVDAIRYEKKLNDVNFVAQTIYDRHTGSYKDNGSVDFYPIWNIDFGTNYKGHNLYLNFYRQDEPNFANRRFGLGLPLGTAAGQQTSDRRWDVEFGSRGALSKCGHLNYDLGFVHTDYKADIANTAATSWISPEMKGWMGYAAVNWDSKKSLKSKVSYTYSDDEALAAYGIYTNKRYSDGPETPFEDISRGNKYFSHGLQNMYDLKFQVEYKQKASKHYFRVVGDWLDEVKDTVTNDFTKFRAGAGQSTTPVAAIKTNTAYDKWNNIGIADPRAFMFTFEYRYQLAKNARIRVGYTNFDFTGDAQKELGATPAISAGRGLKDDYDYQMFWTEIYSKF